MISILPCRCSLACLLPVLLLLQVPIQVQAGDLDCLIYKGDFRDCMCGEMVRDIIRDCQDENTYLEPMVSLETRFYHRDCRSERDCLNGGTFRDGECHCPEGYSGFCCQTEYDKDRTIQGLPICGDVLLTPSGTISTPGFPKYSYPPNVTCFWRISTDEKKKIALSVKNNAFDIEPGTGRHNCDNDYLAIYDGPNKDAVRIGSYCGNQRRRLETVHSRSRHLYIEFNSNSQNQNQHMGFELHYTTYIDSPPDGINRRCGPRIHYELETGVITSPGYPVDYGNKEYCQWEIRALPEHDIIIEFLEMNIPSGRGCSRGDNITLSKKSSRLSKELTVLDTFCGTSLYPRYTVIAPHSVMLEFKSDNRRGGTFKLSYHQVPSKVSTEDIKETRLQ